MYHFLVQSKPRERIDLFITGSMNIYQIKKKNKVFQIVMKACFSEEKLIKQYGNPPFKENSPLSTNLLFLSNFFMTPLFVQILKRRNSSLILRGVRKYENTSGGLLLTTWCEIVKECNSMSKQVFISKSY